MKKVAANVALMVATTLVGLLVLEGAVRLLDLMPTARKSAYGKRDVENVGDRDQAADAPASRWMIHPYRGITTRPGEPPGWDDPSRIHNVFGVVDTVVDPRLLPEEDIVVGIFGGSVAMSTALMANTFVVRGLEQTGWPDGRRVQVINFAIAGYKQPQQLYLLSEALLLGVPFDVVVNLDGFNEVAIGSTDADDGHHPYLPNKAFWQSGFGAATGSLTTEQIELTARAIEARRRASHIRRDFSQVPWQSSALFQAFTGARAARSDAEAVRLEQRLQRLAAENREVEVFDLESPCLGEGSGCWPLVIDLWSRSSRAMEALAEANGADYFHFLQPNQYVAGSKTLNAEELEIAWAPDLPWSRAAAAGYPRLREEGRRLEALGVRWHDLTQLFAGLDETIYKDTCCHYQPAGYFLIAERLGQVIGETLRAERRSPEAARPVRAPGPPAADGE